MSSDSQLLEEAYKKVVTEYVDNLPGAAGATPNSGNEFSELVDELSEVAQALSHIVPRSPEYQNDVGFEFVTDIRDQLVGLLHGLEKHNAGVKKFQ